MNTEEYIYTAMLLVVIGLIVYAVWWACSRAYYYFLYGSLDPIFREKDDE